MKLLLGFGSWSWFRFSATRLWWWESHPSKETAKGSDSGSLWRFRLAFILC